ncbi:MAG: MazG nucleotide pyrophosphohydrolase domain-containing protein [Nitrospirota bacterium]
MNNIQETVDRFTKKHQLSTEIHNWLIDLTSEVGELCKEYNKATDYGQKNFKANKDFEMELGDVFFSLLLISNLIDIDVEETLNKTILKLKGRMRLKGNLGSGK